MKYNSVSFYLDLLNDDENPIWGVCEAGNERQVRYALADAYGVDPQDLVWIETAEYFEDPDDYLEKSKEYSVWL